MTAGSVLFKPYYVVISSLDGCGFGDRLNSGNSAAVYFIGSINSFCALVEIDGGYRTGTEGSNVWR